MDERARMYAAHQRATAKPLSPNLFRSRSVPGELEGSIVADPLGLWCKTAQVLRHRMLPSPGTKSDTCADTTLDGHSAPERRHRRVRRTSPGKNHGCDRASPRIRTAAVTPTVLSSTRGWKCAVGVDLRAVGYQSPMGRSASAGPCGWQAIDDRPSPLSGRRWFLRSLRVVAGTIRPDSGFPMGRRLSLRRTRGVAGAER